MMVLFDYIGKMALVSGVLYAYYHWVLRDNRFHQWNRFYLLAAVFLSLTLPLFHISLARQTATDNRLLSAVYALLDQKGSGTAPVMLNPPTGINWQVVLISSYLCISALLMLLFCTRLLHLGKLKHRSPIFNWMILPWSGLLARDHLSLSSIGYSGTITWNWIPRREGVSFATSSPTYTRNTV